MERCMPKYLLCLVVHLTREENAGILVYTCVIPGLRWMTEDGPRTPYIASICILTNKHAAHRPVSLEVSTVDVRPHGIGCPYLRVSLSTRPACVLLFFPFFFLSLSASTSRHIDIQVKSLLLDYSTYYNKLL